MAGKLTEALRRALGRKREPKFRPISSAGRLGDDWSDGSEIVDEYLDDDGEVVYVFRYPEGQGPAVEYREDGWVYYKGVRSHPWDEGND